jgi:hypothetical protein
MSPDHHAPASNRFTAPCGLVLAAGADMTHRTRAFSIVIATALAVGACATSDVDDTSEGDDGADHGKPGNANLSWLAEQAKLVGSIELVNVQGRGNMLNYPTNVFNLEIGKDGFHKFNLPSRVDDTVAQLAAGFVVPEYASLVDTLECSVTEASPWEKASPPTICIMGPTFHDCKNTVHPDRDGRYSFLDRSGRGQPWQTATLLVVLPRKNLEAGKNVYTGPSGYALACAYIDYLDR